jgi:hypothetical protein
VSVGLCSENWLLVLSNPNPHTGGSPQAPSETPRYRENIIPSHPNRDRVINRILTQGHVGLDYLFCFWLVGLADLICLVPVFILDLLTAGIFVVGAATWVNVWSESRNKV